MGKPVIINVPDKNDTVVATRSVSDMTVVAHGRDLRSVLRRARRVGAKEPVLMFVPRPDAHYVF